MVYASAIILALKKEHLVVANIFWGNTVFIKGHLAMCRFCKVFVETILSRCVINMGTLALKIKTHFFGNSAWTSTHCVLVAAQKDAVGRTQIIYIRAKDLFLSLVPTCVVTSSFSTRGNTLWSQPPPRWTLIQKYGFCSKRIHKTDLLFLRSWSFCAASASSYFSKNRLEKFTRMNSLAEIVLNFFFWI